MIFYIGTTDFNDPRITNINISTAVELIKEHKLIAEDIETIGLDPHKYKDPITLVQIGTREDQFVFNNREIDLSPLKGILEDESIIKINANGVFERNMLRSLDIELRSMFDLLLAFKVYRQGRKDRQVETKYGSSYIYSLAGMYKELLDVDLKKDVRSSFLENDKITLEQVLYGARDVEIFDLYDEIVRKLIKNKLLHKEYEYGDPKDLIERGKYSVTVLEMMVLEWFADMSYVGIKIDKNKWTKLYERNIKRRKEIEKKLNEYVVNNVPGYHMHKIEPVHEVKEEQLDIFGNSTKIHNDGKKDRRRINWNSSPQVRKIFNKEFGFIPKDKGKETLDIKVLQRTPQISGTEFGKNFIKYKKLEKLISSYGIKYFENINPNTDRIHFDINQVLTSGRIAPRNPNLAQIPGVQEWRECFIPEEGNWIVGGDYAGQESQVMADKSKDKAFIEFFLHGDGDSHSMVASRVFSSSLGKKIKVSKFELTFPKGNNPDASLEEAKSLYPNYLRIEEDEDNFYIKGYINKDDDEDDKKSNPMRKKGKVLNFFISFGGTAYTLSTDMSIPLEEAENLIKNFWKSFPQLKEYFDREKKFALKNGYSVINNITGRRRYYPDWKIYRSHEKDKQKRIREYEKKNGRITNWKKFFRNLLKNDYEYSMNNKKAYKIKLDIEKEGMNVGIQGTAADMTKTSCILMHREFKSKGISTVKEIMPVNYVHDENVLESIDKYKEYATDALDRNMRLSSELFNEVLVIPTDAYFKKFWKK